MNLRILPERTSLKGKKVLLRVDWNVPLSSTFAPHESLKLERSFAVIEDLQKRGATVVLMTHLGRPKKFDARYSTEDLARLAHRMSDICINFLPGSLEKPKELESIRVVLDKAKPGSVYLLENVRFLEGEETNKPALAKAMASLADIFINDAFASCHRVHASVVGVARQLPAYAGASLLDEVKALGYLLAKPKRPFIAIIGGIKLSTKMQVLEALLNTADEVLIGGAMAHPFFQVKNYRIGKSFSEKISGATIKKMLKRGNLVLPKDVLTAPALKAGAAAHCVAPNKVGAREIIGDIGTETMMDWAAHIKKAKTIVWNGPVGVAEIPTFSHGSLFLARAIAARSQGSAFGVVGGGDTLPIVMQSGMSEWIDHISTGGGAMLEFLANKGKLPGLLALKDKGGVKK
ncbi:phosphoglycerate kinase [Patescibacteria group bacterium]|nr:phosphoglycerate kinase [Patescibacteria group bacterium]